MKIEYLKRFIERSGRIPVHAAITISNAYYYAQSVIGDDFITAAEVSKEFLAGVFASMKNDYRIFHPKCSEDSLKSIILIEFGPGNGTLISYILRGILDARIARDCKYKNDYESSHHIKLGSNKDIKEREEFSEVKMCDIYLIELSMHLKKIQKKTILREIDNEIKKINENLDSLSENKEYKQKLIYSIKNEFASDKILEIEFFRASKETKNHILTYIVHWLNDFCTLPMAIEEKYNEKSNHRPLVFGIANEFLDALPVRQYTREENGKWHEINISLNSNNEFILCKAPVYGLQFVDNNKLLTQDVQLLEVSSSSQELVNIMCDLLNTYFGAFYIFDYGYIERRSCSTIHAIKNHESKVDFWNYLCLGDISHFVDFTLYRDIAIGYNLYVNLTKQIDFIKNAIYDEHEFTIDDIEDGRQNKSVEYNNEIRNNHDSSILLRMKNFYTLVIRSLIS